MRSRGFHVVVLAVAGLLAAPLVTLTGQGGEVAAAAPSVVQASAPTASASQSRSWVIKGRIGRGKRSRTAKASKVTTRGKAASTYSTTRSVVAGTVDATATFDSRCAPVSMNLVQNSTALASGRGSSPLRISATVATGTVSVNLASSSCRTKFAVLVVNTPAVTPAPTSMPQGDLPGWKAVVGEEFTTDAALGTFLATYQNFGAYPYPWTDTSRNVRSNPGYYHPEKTLSVSGGALDAWLHYDSELGRYLVAAPTPNLPQMTYGRFAMRLRADRIAGYKIAPLLWPDSERWPDDGEIDFPEGDLDGTSLKAFHHYARSTGGQDVFDTRVDPTAWHVYETIWSPGRVEFLVDGQSIGSSTNYVPSTPMHWVLQMETEISSTAPPTSSSGHVQIDWVKAYTYAA